MSRDNKLYQYRAYANFAYKHTGDYYSLPGDTTQSRISNYIHFWEEAFSGLTGVAVVTNIAGDPSVTVYLNEARTFYLTFTVVAITPRDNQSGDVGYFPEEYVHYPNGQTLQLHDYTRSFTASDYEYNFGYLRTAYGIAFGGSSRNNGLSYNSLRHVFVLHPVPALITNMAYNHGSFSDYSSCTLYSTMHERYEAFSTATNANQTGSDNAVGSVCVNNGDYSLRTVMCNMWSCTESVQFTHLYFMLIYSGHMSVGPIKIGDKYVFRLGRLLALEYVP